MFLTQVDCCSMFVLESRELVLLLVSYVLEVLETNLAASMTFHSWMYQLRHGKSVWIIVLYYNSQWKRVTSIVDNRYCSSPFQTKSHGNSVCDSTYPLNFWRQIPDVNNQSPAGKNIQKMSQQSLLITVPERVSEAWVILQQRFETLSLFYLCDLVQRTS
jgi:hypothetical protein